MKNKGIKLVSIILLANFLLVNLGHAQGTPAPTPTPNIIIDKAKENLAQQSKANCQTFRNEIWNATKEKFKAIWSDAGLFLPDGSPITINPNEYVRTCFIVPGDFPDTNGIDGDGSAQPAGSAAMQDQINAGKGFTESTLIESQLKDAEDRGNAGVVSNLIGWLINLLFLPLNATVGMLTALAGGVFAIAVDNIVKVTTMPRVVDVGWTIVRDFTNMFFILIMIVIALATILRIENYSYRHLLVKLILMALLVNFSQVIAVTIINAVNSVVVIFAFQGGWDGLKQVFGFVLNYVAADTLSNFPTGGWLASLVQSISKFLFSLVSLVAFLALALMFVIRLVGLYFLVILSPLAFALNILPATEKYAHEWWHTFIKYLIWAPVALFFVRLAVLFSDPKVLTGANDSAFKYFILMGFLLGAVMVAKKAGMVGTDMILNAGKTVGGMAMGTIGRAYTKNLNQRARSADLAKKPLRAGLYKGLAFLNPVAAKKAWEQRAHHLDEEVYGPAVGAMHDTLNRVMPTEWGWGKIVRGQMKGALGRRTQFGEIEANRMLNKKTKEINEAPLTEKQRVKLLLDSHHADDIRAALRSVVLNNHQDGAAAELGLKVDDRTGAYDPVVFRKAMFDRLSHAGMSPEAIGQEMNYLSELSEGARKFRDLGAGLEEDIDGVARATVDLTAVKARANDQDFGGLQSYLKRINVINDKNEFVNRRGVVVGVVNSAKDFNDLLDKTKSERLDNGGNFEHVIMSARAAKESQRRAKRMDAEDLVKGLEPAGVSIQHEGKWEVLSEQGTRFMEGLPPSVGMAIPGMRRTAPRMQALVGMLEREDGSYDYESMLSNPKAFKILVEMTHTAPEISSGFLTKAKLPKEFANRVATLVNTQLKNLYKDSKAPKKLLDLGGEKEGGTQFQVKQA